MGRSQESYQKKEVRNKKEKKRKEKEKKRLAKKESGKSSQDDMIAYVDENGNITSTPPDPNKKTEIKSENIEIGVSRREKIKADPIRKGIVSFFNDSKGFGFIRDLETNESIFVHVNAMIDEVAEGDRVTFEVEKGPRGLSAVRVKLS